MESLWENMTSSTKPEVHKVSQRRQRRTETRTQATCTKNLVKFGSAVFKICERTDRQTDKQTYDTTVVQLVVSCERCFTTLGKLFKVFLH